MSPRPHPRSVYEFGPFRVEPVECRLLRDDRPLSLSPKAFDTLVALVSRHGRLVTKAELLSVLWPDTVVEESSLSQHVYLVRKALGDERGEARWIETVPKHGYRFAGPVRHVLVEEAEPAIGLAPQPSRAGAGAASGWRAHRVAGLAALALLSVMTAASSRANRARPAATPARLEVRVAPLALPPPPQVETVGGMRRTARMPARAEAYDAYVRGLSFWSRRTAAGLRQAIRHFEDAVAQAPDYAPAWAGLADARAVAATLRYGSTPPAQGYAAARAAANKAVELDPELPEAHAALALILANEKGGRREAERHYRIALSLDAGFTTALQRYARLLLEEGRLEVAVELTERALALDPMSPSLNANLCYFLYLEGQYRRAAGYCDTAVEIQPDLPQPLTTRALIEGQEGRLRPALALLERARQHAEGTALLDVLEAQGYAFARAGRPDRARAALEELRRLTSATDPGRINMLGIHTALGDTDGAFDLLRSCSRDWNVRPFEVAFDPRYESLRRDPRYGEVMSRTGETLADTGDSSADAWDAANTIF